MWKKTKTAIARWLVPFVRLYFRYTTLRTAKRYLWKAFFWRERVCTARTNFGARMRLRTNDMIQGRIYYFGIWEPSITAFIQSRLTNQFEATFVDVGANVGYYSLLAAKCMPNGSIVSIEAFPEIYQQLLTNIALNPFRNIRAVNCAATDTPRQVKVYYAGWENEGATTTVENRFQSKPTLVQGYPLGDILTSKEIEATRLIKIDVEGAEHSVVKGMSSLLGQFENSVEVIIEISPAYLSKRKVDEIFTLFSQHGFYPYRLVNPYSPDYYLNSRKVHQPELLNCCPAEQTDVIFSRRRGERFFH